MNRLELKFNFGECSSEHYPLNSLRFNDLTLQLFNAVPASLPSVALLAQEGQTQSNLVKPNQATPPLPVKKSVKKRSSSWLFLIKPSCAPFPLGFLSYLLLDLPVLTI
jgi:hypothetical protein